MADENTYAGPYAQPSEELKEEVVTAVLNRLKDPGVRSALEVAGDGAYTKGDVREIAMFGLSTQQPVTIDGLHALEKPSSWGFFIDLVEKKNGDSNTQTVFAAAGQSADGKDYRYSTIINVPEAVKRKKTLNIVERSGEARVAFLQIPAYRLSALWFRTDRPKDDILFFLEPKFGRFSGLGISYKLEDLVHYMNDSLAAGAPLLKEKDRGDYIDASEKEPDTKK